MPKRKEKPIVWLHGEVKTPPFTFETRIEAGYLLGELQRGQRLSLPQSRPMPSIGARCHELRVKDEDIEWRIVYRIYDAAIVVAEIFEKKTRKTPQKIIDLCARRYAAYDKEIANARKARQNESRRKKKS